MTLLEKLQQKRANYVRSLQAADLAVLQAEQAVRDATRNLRTAKESRAAVQQGLQVMEETLSDLAEAGKPAPAATPKS